MYEMRVELMKMGRTRRMRDGDEGDRLGQDGQPRRWRSERFVREGSPLVQLTAVAQPLNPC